MNLRKPVRYGIARTWLVILHISNKSLSKLEITLENWIQEDVSVVDTSYSSKMAIKVAFNPTIPDFKIPKRIQAFDSVYTDEEVFLISHFCLSHGFQQVSRFKDGYPLLHRNCIVTCHSKFGIEVQINWSEAHFSFPLPGVSGGMVPGSNRVQSSEAPLWKTELLRMLLLSLRGGFGPGFVGCYDILPYRMSLPTTPNRPTPEDEFQAPGLLAREIHLVPYAPCTPVASDRDVLFELEEVHLFTRSTSDDLRPCRRDHAQGIG
ncbi:hypothetical protein LXL04_028883 [Taraxacum kok-saghyz]